MIGALAERPRSLMTNIPPPLETATADDVRRWVKTGTYYGAELRCRDVSRHRRAELYDQCIQWIRKSWGGFEDGASGAQWEELYWGPNDPTQIPTPVFNEGLGARINESARLGRPNYRPIVTPKSETPDLPSREGSKAMQDSLAHSLKDFHWDDKQGPLLYYHMPLYGGVYWKSWFELRWDKIVNVPLPSAVSCPECGKVLSDRTIQPQHIDQIGQAAPMAMEPFAGISQGPVSLGWCPWCADHPSFKPYPVSMDEASQGATDVFKRPLGTQKPMGDWAMKVCSPYDIFVRNMGLDQKSGELDEVTEAHVEHLDWIGLRWPDKVNQIKPENPSALAREHPVAGSPDVLRAGLDGRLFENCARVVERHKNPWMEPQLNMATGQWEMKLNQGRSAIMCGDICLFYGPLLMASANYPGQSVERVMYDYIPWEMRDGGRRLQGLGLWDVLFDPQDASNETRSQTQAVRKRLAVPMYIALTSHNFQIQAMRGGIPGMLAEIEVDPSAPNMVPQLINNTTIDEGVARELEDAVQAVSRLGGDIDVEKGNPPPGVSAGNAIAFLKGAASERREPRLARIKSSLKRAWAHGARIKCHMYAEPRPMKYKDDDGEERWKYAEGLDFNFQTDVDVDAEPDFDNAAQEIEKVRDAIQMGVVVPASATPSQKREIGRTLKLPEKMYEDEDRQANDAEREWIEFKDQSRMPRIDPGIDDHSTHYQVHGRACSGAYFRKMEKDGHWDEALEILGGSWRQTLKMIETLTAEEAARQTAAIAMKLMPPPPPQPGMPPMPTPQEMAMMLPPPPPRTDLQARIVLTWIQILTEAGFGQLLANNRVAQQAFKFTAQWRAHMEAHRIEDEIKQRLAAVTPTLAAPGAPQTVANNQPTEAAPPAAPAQ